MQVIVLLLLSIAAVSAAPWASELHDIFIFMCERGQSINLITSTYDKEYLDRIWDFGCQTTFSRPTTCYWTGFLNSVDKPFIFICPFGSVTSGMMSHYDLKAKDRRWQIYCCKGEVEVTRNCEWTGYVNAFENSLRWETPANYYLTGAHSYYGDAVPDRQWSFHICQMK